MSFLVIGWSFIDFILRLATIADEMLKFEGPPRHPLLHHNHVCTSTYDRPDLETSVPKKRQM